MPSGNWSFPCSPRNPAKIREELRLLHSLAPAWRERGWLWGPRSGTQLEFGRLLRGSGERVPSHDPQDARTAGKSGEDLRFKTQTGHLSEDNLRWTARARFGTYKFFGFVATDTAGYAALTPAGEEFISARRPGNTLLRQLLKWQYPDHQHQGTRWPSADFAIFPFISTSRLILSLDGLTREEISLFCFTMRRTEDAAATAEAIRAYRDRRGRHTGRTGKARAAHAIYEAAKARYVAEGRRVVVRSTNDYADALIRSFRYTGLFSVRGSRVVVATGREHELEELVYVRGAAAVSAPSIQLSFGQDPPVRLAEPRPLFPDYDDSVVFYAYYGAAGQPVLPWETRERMAALARSLDTQVADLRQRETRLRAGRTVLAGPQLGAALPEAYDSLARVVDTLRDEKQRLERTIFTLEARSPDRLREALAFYQTILDRDVIDPPTYLEWNTWRVFLALAGANEIIPHLQLDDDLQPLNPAQGNQPDLEIDYGEFLVVAEATLRTGADQRQAEARPVTRHVLDAQRRYNDPFGRRDARSVYGLFVAPRIHPDTANDFFVALKYRVIERQQIAAIPFTIRQLVSALQPFTGIATFHPTHLRRLLQATVDAGLAAGTGDEWLEGIDAELRRWLAALGAPILVQPSAARPVPLPLF